MAWFARSFPTPSAALVSFRFSSLRHPPLFLPYHCSITAYSTATMSKFNLKWGILATGGIAESFARDLFPNPESRGVKDIEHTVVAAASSSSADRAKAFLKEVRAPDSAKAYGSYKELVADPNVDCIYVATPHSHHYQNVMLCLEAGKNVLCEKAFTTNAKQLEALIKKAKEKNLFLMEAVSSRIPVGSLRPSLTCIAGLDALLPPLDLRSRHHQGWQDRPGQQNICRSVLLHAARDHL